MASNSPRTKIKPKQSQGLPPDAVIGGILFAVLLLALGLGVALNGGGSDDFEPTTIPLPTYASGGRLAEGDRLFAREDLNFSYVASAGRENPDLTVPMCAEVQISKQPESNRLVAVDADDNYWVYASMANNPAINGWLPLKSLSQERLQGCEAR